ncbi:MAG TPA: glycosyltransferase family 4 protein [Planctomycetota bacterium]|nr:glycosyltransferase family 4 protein [Planctomycetota bacterium]
MRLLMVSGDRQVVVGEKGPFHAMLREFSRHFERIDVLCPRPVGGAGAVTTTRIWDNVHFHPAPCGRLGMVNFIFIRGRQLLREQRHHLIVSHDYGWFYTGIGSALISRACGVPYLSELHHVPGYPVPADKRERFDFAMARLYVSWARDKVLAFRVVNSVEMPVLLRRWKVSENKLLVLPSLYIDQTLFRREEPRPTPDQDLLFVGRLVNNKGLLTIVDALAELKRRGLRLSMRFIGKGPMRAALDQQLIKRGVADQVTSTAWVRSQTELADAYRRSRALVCASTCEGGPRVTVEAMACGTPVVSTPVGVMGELIRDGHNGALAGFEPRSLADALERVLSDEDARVAMGRAAAEDVACFEYSRAIGVYAQGLKDLIGWERGSEQAAGRPRAAGPRPPAGGARP